jgi:hypothetical protein
VDTAAGGGQRRPQLTAGRAAPLAQFVHAQQRATQRALAADALAQLLIRLSR